MKKLIVFDGQLQPNLGGQFKLESGGQFTPKLLVNLNWKVVVNLTVFSSIIPKILTIRAVCAMPDDSLDKTFAKQTFQISEDKIECHYTYFKYDGKQLSDFQTSL